MSSHMRQLCLRSAHHFVGEGPGERGGRSSRDRSQVEPTTLSPAPSPACGRGEKTSEFKPPLPHAQTLYAEIGEKLAVYDTAEGGGTDAAFAAAATKEPVIERFGLRGFGAHSNDAEYVDLNSVTPRLYLLTRMIMDVSQDKAGK